MRRIHYIVLSATDLLTNADATPITTLDVWDAAIKLRPWWWLYLSLGAIHVTVDHLYAQHLLRVWMDNGRKYVAITSAGKAALTGRS